MSKKPDIDLRAVGRRVGELREAAGLTMRQLEERSGVVNTVISHLEAGKHPNITIRTAYRLALALGVTVDHLLGGPGAGAGTLDGMARAETIVRRLADDTSQAPGAAILKGAVRQILSNAADEISAHRGRLAGKMGR